MAARKRARCSRQGLSKVGSLLMASLSREQASMLLFADLCSRWCEVVGPKLAGRSSPGHLIDGTLYVTASDPLLCQEITMRGGDIASRVKEKWGLEVSGVLPRVGRLRG
ncbi:MAG TPA: DciA family protein, partial [Synergistales bacterium]|nr:DciA family protein [Synergistales bacterium]